jgi:hypothetical protein
LDAADPRARDPLTPSLHVVLAAAVAAEVAAAVVPTMHLWGLNASRFLPPLIRFAPLLLAVAALVPWVGRAARPAVDGLDQGWRLPVALVAVTVALLALLPDRLGFVGDYLLRMGVLSEPGGFAATFPQALPLDFVRHDGLPRAAAHVFGVAPGTIERVLGVLEGAALALLAVHFARVIAAPSRLAVAAVALFGGGFTLFTGYGKPTIEVCLFTAAAGVFGTQLIRENRGAIGFGLATAAALAVHRAGWSLLPGVALGWLLWFRLHGRAGGWKSWRVAIGIGVPVAVFLALLPRLLHLFFGFDVATNFASAEVERQGGMLRAAFSGLRLLDVANVIALLCPLALAVPVLLPQVKPLRRPELVFLAGLVLSFVPSLLFVYVTQGPFRDWDAFAGAGAAISLSAAWLIAETLRQEPRARSLIAAIVLATLVPTLQLLVLHHDGEAGMARTRAFLTEPPRRTEAQRLATLDFIGLRSMRLHRWADAAAAYHDVAVVAPHPRALEFWGVNAAIAGNDHEAESAFAALAARDSTNLMGWVGLWMCGTFLGDSEEVRIARAKVGSFPPGGPEARSVEEKARRLPELSRLLEAASRGEKRPAP